MIQWGMKQADNLSYSWVLSSLRFGESKKKKKEENLRDGRITVIIGFFLYGMHKEYV